MNEWTILYSIRGIYSRFRFVLQDATPRIAIVVALYPFKAIEGGDLSLEKVSSDIFSAVLINAIVSHCNNRYEFVLQNAEYEIIDDSQEHWWKVKDQHGTIGYIPSNYVKPKELLGLDKYEWVSVIF